MEVSLKPTCPRKTRSYIARLKRDLIKARKSIEKALKAKGDDKNEFEWTEVVAKVRKKWGLQFRSHSGVSGFFYISAKYGLVVKRSYLCRNAFRLPKAAIFTEIVPCEDIDEETPIYIQPRADVSYYNRCRALEAIEERNFRVMNDLHEGNVAVFRGQAVLIDW